MLIPIGHDRTEVWRLPWVTLGLVAACCLIFVASLTDSDSIKPAPRC